MYYKKYCVVFLEEKSILLELILYETPRSTSITEYELTLLSK